MSFFIPDAYAAAAPAAQPGSPALQYGFLILLLAMLYFVLIRPQQKRAKEHQKMVNAIGKGDEIVTNGGMLGKIVDVSEQFFTVEIADGVQIKLQRHAVATVLPKGSLKAAEKE